MMGSEFGNECGETETRNICVLMIENYENELDPQVNLVNYGSKVGDLEPLLENIAKVDSRDDDIDTDVPIYDGVGQEVPTTRFLMWDEEDNESSDGLLKRNLAQKIMGLALYEKGTQKMIRRYSIHYVFPNINEYMGMKTHADEEYEALTGASSDH